MEKRITIGLFMDSYFPMVDGVTMVMDNYAKRFKKFANVIVFVPKCAGKEFDDSKLGYKVVRCKSIKMPIVDYSLPIPRLDRKFMKELNNTKLDIVHFHSPFALAKVAIKYGKKNKVPVIGTMHSQFKQDFYRASRSKFLANILTKKIIKTFNKCDECWAVNKEAANMYYKDYHYKEMPRVMNNATGMKPVQDLEKAKDMINKKHNLKEEEKVFLFVGRINKLKNILFIVDSLKILKEKCNFKFKMLFVGDGQDEDELKQYIKEKQMEDDIIMCGRVMDRDMLAAYYARCDLFLFPSLYDTSSIVQIEAASQGKPGVFLEGSVTSGTVEKDVSGYIVENDPNKYAEKIIEIVSDEEAYKKVCENVFKDVYVNWDDKVEEVYNLYLGFINKNKENNVKN